MRIRKAPSYFADYAIIRCFRLPRFVALGSLSPLLLLKPLVPEIGEDYHYYFAFFALILTETENLICRSPEKRRERSRSPEKNGDSPKKED